MTVCDTIAAAAKIKEALEVQRNAELGALAKQYVGGKLKSPEKLVEALERIHRSLDEFQARVEDRQQEELLRPQLRDLPALQAEQAQIVTTRESLIAKFEKQRKDFNEKLSELSNRESQIASQWAQHNEVARKLSALISPDEQAAVTELDRQLAEKRKIREELRAKVGSGVWWLNAITGSKHSTHDTRIKELTGVIASDEHQYKRSQDAAHRAKLDARIESNRRAIADIKKQKSADLKSLAELEGELGLLQAKRDMLHDSILRG